MSDGIYKEPRGGASELDIPALGERQPAYRLARPPARTLIHLGTLLEHTSTFPMVYPWVYSCHTLSASIILRQRKNIQL